MSKRPDAPLMAIELLRLALDPKNTDVPQWLRVTAQTIVQLHDDEEAAEDESQTYAAHSYVEEDPL